MAVAKYYSLILSPNMEITAEGYLICRNVPICRSGYQEYYGHELKDFPGYESSWSLNDDTKYSVNRPKEEVLHKDTIRSFEGKTVVDEHPPENVVTLDNEDDVNCGHAQNVKEGPIHGKDVTLQADLIIKNASLISKIRPDEDSFKEPIRDVSCGYTLKLRRVNGNLEMYHIRGNHVAVVTKGRAGSRVAIGDSAPPEIKVKKESNMPLLEMIFGRGLKAYAADASPEELATLSKEMGKDVASDKKPQPGEVAADKDPHRAAAHAALDRAIDAMKDPKQMGCDAFGKPMTANDLKKDVGKFLGDEKEEPKVAEDKVPELAEDAVDAKEEQDEKTAAEQKDKMVAEDSDAPDDKINNTGKSVLKQANDSVRDFIKTTKPIVASIVAKSKKDRTSQEQTMVDSYNTAVKSINEAGGKAYSALVTPKVPEGIAALATDSSGKRITVIEDHTRFFEGVPYRVGKQRLDEYLAKKGGN